MGVMRLYWLTFATARGTEVQIREAPYMVMGAIEAAIAGQAGRYQAGLELDARTAKRIPKKMIGRGLSRKEAEQLLKKIA